MEAYSISITENTLLIDTQEYINKSMHHCLIYSINTHNETLHITMRIDALQYRSISSILTTNAQVKLIQFAIGIKNGIYLSPQLHLALR